MTFNWKADVDWTLLRNQGYNLTVVFSSSTDGAYYEGAPGSTLCIDEVRILCEEMEE
ncbi:MAG: PCMD domain-containing protein [Prevotella sp.]|nr:PCMD domain-containing protein [Prevotella sp.]